MQKIFGLLILLVAAPLQAGDLETWLATPCYAVIEPKPVSTVRITVPAPVQSGYPVHGGIKWNVEGDWSPSRSFLIQHLQSGQHRGKFDSAWLNSLSRQELISLHDDDHDHVVKSVSRVSAPVVRQRVAVSSCPGGVCPTGNFAQRRTMRRGLFNW